jgi:hypothetical protein
MATYDISRNPWVIDASAVGVGPIWKSYERIEALAWQDVTAQGHQLIIQDLNGKEVFTATAPAPGYFNFQKFMWVNGFQLAKMDSGKLYVTID